MQSPYNLHARALLLLVVLCVHLPSAANGGGFVLPLAAVPSGLNHKGRSLLRNGTLQVHGAVREGYFYANLHIGTPPKQYTVIIDTGSTITYLPCINCKHCGKHMDPAYDPAKSSTATVLGCTHTRCKCGSPSCSCKENKCYYVRHYAEHSSSEGWLVQDKFLFPDKGSSIDVVFGCEAYETGEIYRQRVDGILGMGNNENSFVRQLARSGLVDNKFSLCFGFPSGGALLLGNVNMGTVKLSYTPLLATPQFYYTVELASIALGGNSLALEPVMFNKGYGTVLDSGTTFTYLPTAAYTTFLEVLTAALQGKGLNRTNGPDPTFKDICWKNAPNDFDALATVFPEGKLVFRDDVHITLLPQRYLFVIGRGEYCLGIFDNGQAGTIIGGITVRNMLVEYDLERRRVGFGEAHCPTLGAITPHHHRSHQPPPPKQQQQQAPAEPSKEPQAKSSSGIEQKPRLHKAGHQSKHKHAVSKGAEGSMEMRREQRAHGHEGVLKPSLKAEVKSGCSPKDSSTKAAAPAGRA